MYFWAFLIEVVGLMFPFTRDAAIRSSSRTRRTSTTPARWRWPTASRWRRPRDDPAGRGAFGLLLWLSNQAGWEGHWRYVVVFWLNAVTYLVSYFMIRSIPDLGPGPVEKADMEHSERESQGGFFRALRLPVLRGVLPGVAVVALGLGALFSLGVVFVKNTLDAGAVGFGALVVLFGVGAIAGLLLIHRKAGSLMTQVRLGTAAQGIVIALMGALGSITWSFIGAVVFGAAATSALVGGITYLQEELSGVERNLALTAFHAVLRFGLALAALLSGGAADLLKEAWRVPARPGTGPVRAGGVRPGGPPRHVPDPRPRRARDVAYLTGAGSGSRSVSTADASPWLLAARSATTAAAARKTLHASSARRTRR